MTKKIILILLVSFSLSACGGGSSSVSGVVSDPIEGRGMPSQLGD